MSETTRSRARAAAVAVACGALFLAGCRADGGFGRRDNAISAEWTAQRIGLQFDRDVDDFSGHFRDAGGRLEDDFDHAGDGIRATRDLYTRGNAYPIDERVGRPRRGGRRSRVSRRSRAGDDDGE